ncbi:MAG: RNA-binding protein [Myxococcota bacterium]
MGPNEIRLTGDRRHLAVGGTTTGDLRRSRLRAEQRAERLSKKLFVGGLAWATDEASLRAAFEEYGPVAEAKVILDRDTGRSRGFGFVTFQEQADAEKAMTELDGKELDGRRIRVNEAQARQGGGGGGRGRGGGGGFGGGGGGRGFDDRGGGRGFDDRGGGRGFDDRGGGRGFDDRGGGRGFDDRRGGRGGRGGRGRGGY